SRPMPASLMHPLRTMIACAPRLAHSHLRLPDRAVGCRPAMEIPAAFVILSVASERLTRAPFSDCEVPVPIAFSPHTQAPSYYAASAPPGLVLPCLAGSHSADVCIIGGGFTGLN